MQQVQSCCNFWLTWMFTHIFLTWPTGDCKVLLRRDSLTLKNLTSTSATVVWSAHFDMSLEEASTTFRLIIRRQRQGYSENMIISDPHDPDCSLRISKCLLTNLVPDTVYRIIVTVDGINGSDVSGGELIFSTLPTLPAAGGARDTEWWLMVAVGPAVAGAVIVLITAALCRVCHCCCWRKVNPTDDTTTSSRHVLRSESHATRQWVKDTFHGVDSASFPTYDQPSVSPTSSLSTDNQHGYLPINKNPNNKQTRPETKRTPRLIVGNAKPSPSTSPPSAPNMANINTESMHRACPATASSQYQNSERVLLTSYPGHGRATQRNHKQEVGKAVAYANKEDMREMHGAARKMFPML